MKSLILALIAVLLIGGCQRPWADVPATPTSPADCAEPPTKPVGICDVAPLFDDLIVFDIDRKQSIEAPLFTQSGEDFDGACSNVDPAITLAGVTEATSHGFNPKTVIIPGGHDEPLHAGDLLPTTRVLLPVVKADSATAVRVRFWLAVQDGIVTAVPSFECADGDTIVGKSADALIEEASKCAEVGTSVDRDSLITGAVCFADPVEVECSIDGDCAEAGARCVEHKCESP